MAQEFRKILQNTNYASVFYGTTGGTETIMYRIPRVKYMYYATFQVNTQALSMFPNLKDLGSWQNGVSFKVKTVDKPNVDLQTRELNQYNRKRYAYTKTEYKPVNITIYDTVDNVPFQMWIQYFAYYFGDVRLKSQTTMGTSPVDPTFDDSTGWGLRPLVDQVNFFTSLDIYALYNKKYTLTSYLNPKITAIDWGNHDSTSSDLEEVRMTLSYETLQYDSGDITPSQAIQFGFNSSQFIEPAGVPEPIGEPTRPQLFGSLAATQTVGQNRPVITSTAGGIHSDFGMSGASYSALVGSIKTNNIPAGNYPKAETTVFIPAGQTSYATSLSGDIVYNSITGSQGSDLPPVQNVGIAGLPLGQLPTQPTFVQIPSTDVFEPISVGGTYTLLGSFGSFNFGSGLFPAPSGSKESLAYDPMTGEFTSIPFSTRPAAPDWAFRNAAYVDIPGGRRPHLRFGRRTRLNSYGSDSAQIYYTQAEQIQQARRRVQRGGSSISLEVGIADGLAFSLALGNPEYDDYGVYTGYEEAPYQPAPPPEFGPDLYGSASNSNSTTELLLALTDALVFGGDISDNEPPPVVYPYDLE